MEEQENFKQDLVKTNIDQLEFVLKNCPDSEEASILKYLCAIGQGSYEYKKLSC